MEHYRPDEWTRRGKKYKAQTFAALKQLYGGTDDKDCENEGGDSDGSPGTDSLCDVAQETGILGICER